MRRQERKRQTDREREGERQTETEISDLWESMCSGDIDGGSVKNLTARTPENFL